MMSTLKIFIFCHLSSCSALVLTPSPHPRKKSGPIIYFRLMIVHTIVWYEPILQIPHTICTRSVDTTTPSSLFCCSILVCMDDLLILHSFFLVFFFLEISLMQPYGYRCCIIITIIRRIWKFVTVNVTHFQEIINNNKNIREGRGCT